MLKIQELQQFLKLQVQYLHHYMSKKNESPNHLGIEIPGEVQLRYEQKYMPDLDKLVIIPPLESQYSDENKAMNRISNFDRISKYPVQNFEKNPELFANLAHLIYQRERLFNPGRKKDVAQENQTKGEPIDITTRDGLMRLGAHVKTHALVGEKRHGVSDTLSIPEWDWQGLETGLKNRILSLEDFDRIVIDTVNYLRAHLYTGLNQDVMTNERMVDESARREDMLLRGVQTLKDIKGTLMSELQESLDRLKNTTEEPQKLEVDKEIYVQKMRHLLWVANKLNDQKSRVFVLNDIKTLMPKLNITEEDLTLNMATHAGMADTEFRTVYHTSGIKQLAYLEKPDYSAGDKRAIMLNDKPTYSIDSEHCATYTFQQMADSLSRPTGAPSLLAMTPQMDIGWKVEQNIDNTANIR
jgi:hypothetical protein